LGFHIVTSRAVLRLPSLPLRLTIVECRQSTPLPASLAPVARRADECPKHSQQRATRGLRLPQVLAGASDRCALMVGM